VTLIQEIIDGASGEIAVPTLLRKFKIVAARTQTDRLADWVSQELHGYESSDDLPEYRGPFDALVLGHFVGAFSSEIKNVPIAPSTFPADMRESHLFKLWLMNPIAEIEEMAQQESAQIAWPADALRYYNYGIQQGLIHHTVREDMALATAVRPIARQVFVGVLDAVRTRVLDLALDLERVAPDAGQPDAPDEARIEAARVINTYNFHGSSNVAIGSTNVSQTVNLPARNDEPALLRFLAAIGVAPRDLVDLQKALEEDRTDAEGHHHAAPGHRVAAWMGRASTQLGTGAGAGLLVEGIKAFFGL
jgi:hypothetical protein